jgi:hypothetical protein
MTYQLYIRLNKTQPDAVSTTNEQGHSVSFIFNPDNTDYQKFKRDIQNGVVLNDAEGVPVTGDALTTFMETLP